MPGAATDLDNAVGAFLRGGALPAGFRQAQLGSYTALCRASDPAGLTAAPAEPLVLQGSDGALYARDDSHDGDQEPPGSVPGAAELEEVLRSHRLRATGATLALRAPGAPAAARVMTFRRWATAKELAAAQADAAGDTIWK